MAGGGWVGRARAQPRATARVIDVRVLRAMIQVRSVARRVLTSAKRDLADRPETLNCGLLVLHVHRLPEMVNTWLCASGRPTYGRARESRRHLCAVTHILLGPFPNATSRPQIVRRSGHATRVRSATSRRTRGGVPQCR